MFAVEKFREKDREELEIDPIDSNCTKNVHDV
jgi:hypothetical protein